MSSQKGRWINSLNQKPDSIYFKNYNLAFLDAAGDVETQSLSSITNVFFGPIDNDGKEQSDFLKNILVGQQLVFRALANIVDAAIYLKNYRVHDLTVEASGAPILTKITTGLNGYNIPVTPVSVSLSSADDIPINGTELRWEVQACMGGNDDCRVTVFGATQNTGNNTVTIPDTVLTTWDASTFTSRNDRWDTREGDVRKKIYKMTQAKNNISFVYRESLRSMIASFNDVGYIDSEEKFNSIMCIHANAERAIAKLKQENNIILPIISVGQTTSDNDTARQKTESLLVNERYWDAEKNRAFRVLSLAPRAVNVKYQLNIWTKYMSDMDQILEQIRLKFNPEMQVPTEFSTLAKAYLDSEDDVGQVTVADKADRVLKKTLNIVLRTYIPSPKFLYSSTGEIEEFKVETS